MALLDVSHVRSEPFALQKLLVDVCHYFGGVTVFESVIERQVWLMGWWLMVERIRQGQKRMILIHAFCFALYSSLWAPLFSGLQRSFSYTFSSHSFSFFPSPSFSSPLLYSSLPLSPLIFSSILLLLSMFLPLIPSLTHSFSHTIQSSTTLFHSILFSFTFSFPFSYFISLIISFIFYSLSLSSSHSLSICYPLIVMNLKVYHTIWTLDAPGLQLPCPHIRKTGSAVNIFL